MPELKAGGRRVQVYRSPIAETRPVAVESVVMGERRHFVNVGARASKIKVLKNDDMCFIPDTA